ncbi:MAG: NAD(P)H-dependent oxidoreductase subunit E [Acidobacteriota bacterium]|nr:NAD(P)H-dependent oxidoreductase subunit E [Acidobacteriota bacterium]MDH3784559.1 NAD(P)H-dependent oxidoreductase subunit E [Acidobacteriota bacterium]
MFGAEFESKVDGIVKRYPEKKAAMLPVLWEVQKSKGWIDSDSEAWVAERLGTTPAHVHGCVTFYTMYKQKPSGRHHIQVCTTLSCMLRGSDELVEHLKGKLGIQEGEVTADGKFSLVRVECLGSCGTAPMFQLNDDYHEDLTLDQVDRLLEKLD